jgi:hypothetical protein
MMRDMMRGNEGQITPAKHPLVTPAGLLAWRNVIKDVFKMARGV